MRQSHAQFYGSRPAWVDRKLAILKTLAFVGASWTLVPGVEAQQNTLQHITQVELTALEQGIKTQERINALDDEQTALANNYRNTLKDLGNVQTYNRQLRDTIGQQEAEMDLLQDQIQRIGSLEQDIVPLMVDMLEALDNFIDLDLPFLLEERKQRVVRLRNLMSDPKLANSEKYRRILEAYQIENDYGRTIEAYDRKLNNDENAATVTYIKIGRLAYFYQTQNDEQTYRWSTTSHTWEKLDSGDNKAIHTAIAMAKERIPTDLLLVPIEIPSTNDRERVAGGVL